MRRHPTKLPLGGWVPLRAGRYLDQLARYWKKKRKPLDGPEPNRDGTMSHLFREDWRALGSKSGADLVISWSETEPEQVGVFLYYDDEATSDKERWFKLGTPSPTLWEFAKDPGAATLGRMATPNQGEYSEDYEVSEDDELAFVLLLSDPFEEVMVFHSLRGDGTPYQYHYRLDPADDRSEFDVRDILDPKAADASVRAHEVALQKLVNRGDLTIKGWRVATPNPGEEQHEEQEFAVGEFYRWTEESPSEYDFEWERGELWAFERHRRGKKHLYGELVDAPSWVWDRDGEWLMAGDAGVDEHAAERRQMGLVDF